MSNLVKRLQGGALLLAGSLMLPNSTDAGSIEVNPRPEVLTSSARDYVETRGKSLSDYAMKEVHASSGKGFFGQEYPCLPILLKDSPKKTEVIVDYKFANSFPQETICSGTALIPKEKLK